MASTFWIGTDVKVTNGSATVEVTSGDVITKVKENAAFVASNFSLPYEVDRTYTNNGKDYIVLKENWQGASGTGLNAVAVTSPAGIEEARQTLLSLISTYENFANSVKPTVESNAVVQRTSAGRIKTANAVSSDEAVAYGQLGSAAARDVGTSSGNVLEAGAGGIGRVNPLPNGSSLQGEYDNGFYYVPAATSRPTPNAASWYLMIENVSNNPAFRKYTATPVNIVEGSSQPYTCLKINGVFTEWDRGALSQGYGLADAGSTDTFDFGNVRPKSGFYPVDITNSSGNKPVLNGFGTIEVIAGTTNNCTHQFFYGRQPDTDIWFRTKRNSSVDYDPWIELYHSGNSVNPLDYGIGIDSATSNGAQLPSNDIDSFDNPSGMFLVASGVQGTKPDGLSGNAVLTHKIFTTDRQAQVWHTCSGEGDIYIRELPTRAQGWTSWKKIFTEGNTNFNEFGGEADVPVANVRFRNGSTCLAFKDISGLVNAPSSISVTGTFKITNSIMTTPIISGIPANDIRLDKSSNGRLSFLILNIDGSLLSLGEEYELMTETSSSKITLNF